MTPERPPARVCLAAVGAELSPAGRPAGRARVRAGAEDGAGAGAGAERGEAGRRRAKPQIWAIYLNGHGLAIVPAGRVRRPGQLRDWRPLPRPSELGPCERRAHRWPLGARPAARRSQVEAGGRRVVGERRAQRQAGRPAVSARSLPQTQWPPPTQLVCLSPLVSLDSPRLSSLRLSSRPPPPSPPPPRRPAPQFKAARAAGAASRSSRSNHRNNKRQTNIVSPLRCRPSN